ncbi:MAG: DUF2306 domain-containing protein [Acidobacteriia bacterium]|nr:DUF2306 domain-containing protein [Terriglobia bacterium]
MSTASVSISRDGQRGSWLRAKYVLFLLVGAMLAYVVGHNERFLIDARDPEWLHIQPFKWWLLPHGLTAACALLLGPMQFSDRLRRRFAKLHRVAGRFYVAGVLVGAPLGFYVQYIQEPAGASRSFTAAAVVQTATWILTTLIAFAYILKGNVQQHRVWMTRSFAVALVFLEVRVILGVTGWETRGPAMVESVVWFCNTMSIFLADIVLQFQEPGRTRAVKSRAAEA